MVVRRSLCDFADLAARTTRPPVFAIRPVLDTIITVPPLLVLLLTPSFFKKIVVLVVLVASA